MHELSIATSIVNIASEHAAAAGAASVTSVSLSIGVLSCVNEESLRFCFDLAAQDTLLAGAKLYVRRVPLAVYCSSCQRIVDLPGIQLLKCPVCSTPSHDIRRGQELDMESIEIVDPQMNASGQKNRVAEFF